LDLVFFVLAAKIAVTPFDFARSLANANVLFYDNDVTRSGHDEISGHTSQVCLHVLEHLRDTRRRIIELIAAFEPLLPL
jgi:hypothetical protein